MQFAHTIDKRWTIGTYGVRLKYVIDGVLTITMDVGDCRTTQENYNACRAALVHFLTGIGKTDYDVTESDIQVSFYTSK